MNDFHDLLYNRRSIRKYKESEISSDSVRLILEAALAAPSSKSKMPWQFVVVEDKAMLEKLSQNDQTYIVIWDGTEYEVTASPFNGIPCLGNLSIEVPEHENTGEPFLFLHFDQWVVVTNDAGTEHAFSISHANRTIQKLDSKFLADDVGNKLPFLDLKEMGMTDVTSMNAVKTLSVDTTRLRVAMLNGQIKIAFGVDGAVIKTVLSCGIISGNVIYASA